MTKPFTGDLERSGYVSRRADPDDRRAKRIVLTRRGRAAVTAAQRAIADLEAELAALLGSERLAAIRETLEQIVAGTVSDR